MCQPANFCPCHVSRRPVSRAGPLVVCFLSSSRSPSKQSDKCHFLSVVRNALLYMFARYIYFLTINYCDASIRFSQFSKRLFKYVLGTI